MQSVSQQEHLDELLADLTEPQRQAVVHADGPLLVLAGAGSGKTRVITRRAAYLARTVARPWEIVAITFTNKAAQEMRERIEALGVGRGMHIQTFHSFCARLLRTHHERAGLASNFTIFDESDRRDVAKNAVAKCDLDSKNFRPQKVVAAISNCKNAMQTPEDYAQAATGFRERTLARIYKVYQQLLDEEHGVDFDDLLMRTALLLKQDEELREQLESRMRYVLIDEYQDTNDAQYTIARLLTKRNQNLCSTGDPDQSIYGWRGANINNILSFERDYPNATVVRLEQNYRSTKRILAAADQLISGNTQRKKKALWTENDEGCRVRVVDCGDHLAEADWVAQRISRYIEKGGSADDVAVFYRVNSLSQEIELALQRANIKYQVARGQAFYGRREIKDLLAYVRVLINPADNTSFRRIINTPARGIGKTSLARLDAAAEDKGYTLLQALQDDGCVAAMGRSGGKARQFAVLLSQLAPLVDGPAAVALEEVYLHSGLRAAIAGEDTVDTNPGENVLNLIAEAKRYDENEPDGSLTEWLERTSLLGDNDTVDAEAQKVTLMTLHAAKGLEFPLVFMIGLDEGLLPLFRGEDDAYDQTHLEEERRLCFVGMTRAQEELVLLTARYRLRNGQDMRSLRSQFLDELPRRELEWTRTDARPMGKPKGRGPAKPGPVPDRWAPGGHVRHEKYGVGRIQIVHRVGGKTRAVIDFMDGQERSMILEHADVIRLAPDEVGWE